MGGWLEALADRVHEQGEHIPQPCYIPHNHPYISSSGYSVILCHLASYVGMVVWNVAMLWNVHALSAKFLVYVYMEIGM